MTRWIRRILTGAVSVALIAALAVPAMALGGLDNTSGSVTLTVPDESGQREDLAQTMVPVDVYQVATADEDGRYTLTGQFTALAENEHWNGGELTGETDLAALQDAVMAILEDASPEAAESEETAEDAETAEPVPPEPFMTTEVALEDAIDVEELGLYLLAPQDVETARWSYAFSPILLSVPSVDPAADDWTYDCTVTMKLERESRLTSLVIEKALRSYNETLGPTTFLFEVKGELDGEPVYSNVVGVTFSGAGTQNVTVEGIPAGAHVTVTEVYSGASYEIADGKVSVEIDELPLPDDGESYARVDFTNDYAGHRVPDTSVTNTFVFNGTGWQWQSSEEAGQ